MSDFAGLVLSLFLDNIDSFLLINVRILAFIIVLPVLASTSIPNIVKMILSTSISFLIFFTTKSVSIPHANTVPEFVTLVVMEFFVGFTMAFVVFLIFSALYLAGQLIDYQIGFSMLSVLDPFTQIQVPITGNLLYFFMLTIMIQTGALHVFISALFYSYEVVPIGTPLFPNDGKMFMYIASLLKDYLVIGYRIAMPIVGCIFIVDIALGILVKTVPQMNVFVVGMPIKLIIGLVVLFLIVPQIGDMIHFLYDMSNDAITNVLGGFSP